MMSYIWIAIGSAIGGAARYWCTGFAARLFGETFPWGTLLVNITGSLIIGFFATLTGPDGRFFVSSTTRQFVRIPNVRLEYVQNEPKGIQTAFWRSVGPSQNIFVARASLMSLPQPAKKDPVEYRRALLDKSPRAKACSIWPPRSQAGASPCRKAQAAACRCRMCWQLHGAGRRGRGVQGRRRCGQAYHLRGRLRYRDQSQHHRGAGAKRHPLWSDRRPLRRDHAERRPGGTEQFRQL